MAIINGQNVSLYASVNAQADDAVHYTEDSGRTAAEKKKARANIAAVGYTAEESTPTAAQKTQARTNIGAAAATDLVDTSISAQIDIGSTQATTVHEALEAIVDELEDKVDESDVTEIDIVTSSNAVANIASDTKVISPAGVKKITALVLHATYSNGAYTLDEGTDSQGNPVDIMTMIHNAQSNNIPIFLKASNSNYLRALSGLDESTSKNTWIATFLLVNSSALSATTEGLTVYSLKIRYYKSTGLYRDMLYNANMVDIAWNTPITIGGTDYYTAYDAINAIIAQGS